MDWEFTQETFVSLVSALPLTLSLAATAIALGAILALALALARTSGILVLDWFARPMSSSFVERRCWSRSS